MLFGTQQRALRIGLATAAMIGIAAVPTAAMASGNGGAASHLGSTVTAQTAPRTPRTSHLETLATALGVTPDVLQTAMQAARTSVGKPDPATMKDPAARAAFEAKYVAALAANLGKDVATVQAALDASKPQGPKPGQGAQDGQKRGHPGIHDFGAKHLDAIAQAIGKTAAEVKAAFKAAIDSVGKPDRATMKDQAAREAFELKMLTAAATNLNVDVTKLQDAIKAAQPDRTALKAEARTHLAARLAQQVASGKLTQAQADQMLADFDAGKAPKPGLRAGGSDQQGRDGGHGRPQGAPKSQDNS